MIAGESSRRCMPFSDWSGARSVGLVGAIPRVSTIPAVAPGSCRHGRRNSGYERRCSLDTLIRTLRTRPFCMPAENLSDLFGRDTQFLGEFGRSAQRIAFVSRQHSKGGLGLGSAIRPFVAALLLPGPVAGHVLTGGLDEFGKVVLTVLDFGALSQC